MSKKLTKKQRAIPQRNKLNRTEKLENGNTKSTSWVKVAHEWVQISCTFDEKGNMVDCNDEFKKLLKRTYSQNTSVEPQEDRPTGLESSNQPYKQTPPSSSIELKEPQPNDNKANNS